MKDRGQGPGARGQKKPYASPAQAEADRLLAEFDQADRQVKALEAAANLALAAVQLEWAKKIKPAAETRSVLDCSLKALMNEHQADFFVVTGLGSCSLDLPHGTLLYDKSDYVVKPRKVDVLANLERYGFEEAIIRTKTTNWEVLANKDEWPDEVLAIIGTRREIKETYAYEISPLPQPPYEKPLKGEGVKQEA